MKNNETTVRGDYITQQPTTHKGEGEWKRYK